MLYFFLHTGKRKNSYIELQRRCQRPQQIALRRPSHMLQPMKYQWRKASGKFVQDGKFFGLSEEDSVQTWLQSCPFWEVWNLQINKTDENRGNSLLYYESSELELWMRYKSVNLWWVFIEHKTKEYFHAEKYKRIVFFMCKFIQRTSIYNNIQ